MLKATLGSCVGIGFVDEERGLFGLAHCLLPQGQSKMKAKYVNEAVDNLIKEMGLKTENYKKVLVYLSGGANMMDQIARGEEYHVGRLNAEAAKAELKKRGFKIARESTGGEQAHQISIDCMSGLVEMKHISSGA